MNKQNFMEQLESLLSPISAQERELALQYYVNYFEDAGEEKEMEVIAELGRPADVAKIIFEEVGYKEDILENKSLNANSAIDEPVLNQQTEEEKVKEKNVGKIILWSTAIIWVPVWFALVLVIALGLFPTVAVLVLVFALLAVIFGVLGIACFGGGLVNLFTVPAFGISLLGAAIIFIALCIAFALFTWFLASVVIQGLAKLLAWICKLPFYTKEEN